MICRECGRYGCGVFGCDKENPRRPMTRQQVLMEDPSPGDLEAADAFLTRLEARK